MKKPSSGKKQPPRIPPLPTDIVVDQTREGTEPRDVGLREQHLAQVCHWYIGGKTQAWMADQLGVTQVTIHNDIKEIQKRWVESTLLNWDEEKNKVLAKLDWVEKEAIDAWERSKADEAQTTATVTDVGDAGEGKKKPPAKKVSQHRVKKRDGGAVWLNVVLDVCRERAKLFDLYVNKNLSNAEIEEIMNAFAEAVIAERRNEYAEAKQGTPQNKLLTERKL